MKYVISLFVGMLAGACIFLTLLFFNPLASRGTLSPLSVSDHEVISLSYSAVPTNMLLYTNDGESQADPHPPKVLQLWEPPIKRTNALVTVLEDARGQATGLGVKFSSDSDRTSVLKSKALVDSVWHIYIPERGSIFVEQTENYWGYLREIVIPAHWSSADNWRGSWFGNLTSGPGALGLAKVSGGSGDFAGLSANAVESLSAKAFSVEQGPVAMTGQITVELPEQKISAAAQ